MNHLITPQFLKPRGPQLYDSVRMRGFLQIRVLDAITRKALRIIQVPNTVCRGARVALETIVTQLNTGGAGTDTNYNKLWSIWAGDDNTLPVNTQLQLVSASGHWFRKVFDPGSVMIDAGGIEGMAQVSMTMEAGEGVVGRQYQEVGLFSRGDDDDPTVAHPWDGAHATYAKMYARQIHAPIEKDAIIAIEYTWRFQFTI